MSETKLETVADSVVPAEVEKTQAREEKRAAQHDAKTRKPAEDGGYSYETLLTTEISHTVKRQEEAAKKTLLHARIRTGIAVVVALCVCFVAFQAVGILGKANRLVANLDALVGQVDTAVSTITTTVDELDLKTTLSGVDTLIASGTGLVDDGTALIAEGNAVIATSADQLTDVMSGAKTTLDKLAAVDFETLNASIQRLDLITQKFGALFGIK